MSHTRREFLRSAAAAGSLLGLGAQSCAADGSAPAVAPFRISLAEWSLHRALQGGRMDHLDFPTKARIDFGIEGVEYVNSFFKDKARDEAYLAELDRRCRDVGVASLLIMCDGEGECASHTASCSIDCGSRSPLASQNTTMRTAVMRLSPSARTPHHKSSTSLALRRTSTSPTRSPSRKTSSPRSHGSPRVAAQPASASSARIEEWTGRGIGGILAPDGAEGRPCRALDSLAHVPLPP